MAAKLLTARDLMSTRLMTVPPAMRLGELVDFLRENKIHGALVQDEARLVGVISYTDVMIYLADQDEEGQPFWRSFPNGEEPGFLNADVAGLDEGTVEDAMTPNVITCQVSDSAGRVAELEARRLASQLRAARDAELLREGTGR